MAPAPLAVLVRSTKIVPTLRADLPRSGHVERLAQWAR
jgi:hypothetical protein